MFVSKKNALNKLMILANLCLVQYLSASSPLVRCIERPVTTTTTTIGSETINLETLMLNSNHNSSARNRTIRKKLHLVVATLESPPFVMKRRSASDNQTVEWYGYCLDFFEELIKHMPYDITYEIYQVADNKFGTKTKQIIMETTNASKYPVPRKMETWNGLIGDLHQGKAHIALAPMAVMAERELAIDFTVPFYDLVGIQILIKKPEVAQDWFKFLTVLDNEVWLSITIAYFVTSVVIFLFDRLSPYSHKNVIRLQRINENRKKPRQTDFNINDPIRAISNGFNQKASYLTNMTQPKSSGAIQLTANYPLGSTPALPFDHTVESSPSPRYHSSSKLTLSSQKLLESPAAVARIQVDDIKLMNLASSDISAAQTTAGSGGVTSRARRMSNDYWQAIRKRASVNSIKPVVENDADADSDDLSDQVDDGRPDFGLRDSLWFCITSLTPQGGGEAPQNLSGRVVAGAWWLFCFIVIASYTANLAAFLTVSRLDIPIESLDDLAKQYRIKYAPIDGTAEQTYFERMAYIEEIFYNIWKEMSLNDSLSEEERSKFAVWDYPISDKYTKIWAQIQEVGMPSDIESAIRRVKNSNLDDGFALLADANLVKHAVMTDCSFKAAGDEFSRKPIALGLRKGQEQLRDDISYAILQLINRRFMEVLREKWWTNNPMRITCENNDESEGISIENIGGVFTIILAGVSLSFLVWAVEKFVYKTKLDISRSLIEHPD